MLKHHNLTGGNNGWMYLVRGKLVLKVLVDAEYPLHI